MRVIRTRNVNQAFDLGTSFINERGQPMQSRAGDVLVADYPVMTVYDNPTERVLFDRQRDANPFFHLMESLWMLNGEKTGEWLDQFVGDFTKRFAEPDSAGMLWGAYGHRWRTHFDVDQLSIIVTRLRDMPGDRRVVIAMWDPEFDLWDPLETDDDTGIPFTEPRDLPCNTHVYPRVLNGRLDLTVCCRSNDIIWGAYGANAVHFSILQEYLAGRIGVEVGTLYQLSNNYHAYKDILMTKGTGLKRPDPYVTGGVAPMPMGDAWNHWDDDLRRFMEDPYYAGYKNQWFQWVAVPMLVAHKLWCEGRRIEALERVKKVVASDWRMAAVEWMERRMAS